MGIFNSKKEKKRTDLAIYAPSEIYLLTTTIISSYDDGTGCGPRCIKQYYLAKKENDKYYELFSGVEIRCLYNSTEGYTDGEFNTPIIEKIEQFTEYVKDPNKKLSTEKLFYFITMFNAAKIIEQNTKKKKKKKKKK